jgi:TnpA family transposase
VALLGLGSDLTAAAPDRMVTGVAPGTLAATTRRLVSAGRFRAANDSVVSFMRRHTVASLWGRGLQASADMMSLDATRYLWNARLDPRRKGPVIGTYPHVLDQWAIFYDQPIVLGKRQAGAAIEGALRQTAVETLECMAVDTHGFTHFAMATGKFCGLDLCPRLAGIRSRKLYLPRGYRGTVPASLKSVISQETISRKAVARDWDGFARPCASIKEGWYPATDALAQYGSVSQGDPIRITGTAVGKLLRSIYLCDYFGNSEFRDGVPDLLNQGHARGHVLMARISSVGCNRSGTMTGIMPAAWAARMPFSESSTVGVFLLRVLRQLETWPEQAERETQWFDPEQAADLVSETGLADILRTIRTAWPTTE